MAGVTGLSLATVAVHEKTSNKDDYDSSAHSRAFDRVLAWSERPIHGMT